jgi:ferredoxin/flavodoxin---NADP+ reductase
VSTNSWQFAWGFSAVVLANGAGRDRELGIPGAEEFVDKGLVYQNPFIYWYNHKNEGDYTGPHYRAPDEALVVGGGLASIDVVKILQLENYQRVLRARGIPTDVYELEKKGVPAVCKMHGIAPEDLGVKRMPTDLSPPRTRHAAGSASRKCHARSDC